MAKEDGSVFPSASIVAIGAEISYIIKKNQTKETALLKKYAR